MFFLRRPRRKKNKIKEIRPKPDCEAIPSIKNPLLSENARFSAHMANYIGETVTVFVESGGISGAGFTGILLFANEVYIELVISIAPPPACSLNNLCITHPDFPCGIGHFHPPSIPLYNAGAFAVIPVDKIISFAHNNI
ncbi:MAG TPA: hypothetical protein PLH43_08600 [Acetivibrio sp.]|uniref:hypothetical protein n=1 Tax=Acetivibrio sp. TaxID=1872092 RepID=UPI002C088BCF|nr:hypothetical protein [Acetivibrio sp.]HOM02869.1 hypothetical protein [Acetivibrio sp.]